MRVIRLLRAISFAASFSWLIPRCVTNEIDRFHRGCTVHARGPTCLSDEGNDMYLRRARVSTILLSLFASPFLFVSPTHL